MKPLHKQLLPAILVIAGTLLTIRPASAHRVNVFAWVDADTIQVESKFSGGKTVNAGKVVVLGPGGNELASGLTDDDGKFSFKIPRRSDLKIVLIAGQGHRGEWLISAAEINDSAIASHSHSHADISPPPTAAAAFDSGSTTAATTATDIASREELEAIIETVLERKLKPVRRMLAENRQADSPSATDVIAGIGYILGLVGVAAYVQSRKQKG